MVVLFLDFDLWMLNVMQDEVMGNLECLSDDEFVYIYFILL